MKKGGAEGRRNMRSCKRFMALLLTGVLAAGLAAAPAQVRAEETGESPVQEEVLKEEKKDGEKASEEEKKPAPAEAPAEKSEEKQEEKAEEKPEEKAKEDTVKEPEEEKKTSDQAFEEEPDGQKEDVPEAGPESNPENAPEDTLEAAPEEEPAENLAKRPAEVAKLFAAEPRDPEEDGEEDPDFEPYYEYYDEMDDVEVVRGGTEEVYTGGLIAMYYKSESEWEEIELTVTGAVSEDPSVAEAGVEDGKLFVRGKSSGSAIITVTYKGPEGEGTTFFDAIVKETVYYSYILSSEFEGYLDPGSSADLTLSVESLTAGEDEYKPVDEKNVTVVWRYTYEPEYGHKDIFSLEGKGFSAVLKTDSDVPYHERLDVTVTADVYLGSEVSEENLITSADVVHEVADHYYDPDINIDATEGEIFDDPSSESVITISSDLNGDLAVQKWVAVEIGEDGERLGALDYPFDEPGSSLSTTVNGKILGELVSEDRNVEFFAVIGEENGKDLTTDSIYIEIIHGKKEVTCDVDNVKVLPGEEHTEEASVTATIQNMDYPYGESINCEIMGAEAEDPSIAEVSFEDGMLYVKGIKTGTTQAYLKYIGPDGEEGQCPFTVTVAEAIYYVYIDDSYEEYPMLNGDRADLKVSVYRYAKEGDDTDLTELDDDEIEVVWQLESADEGIPVTDFTLETDGSAATLYVTGEADIEEETQTALVRARVYLKGTDEEIGSGEIEHYHPRSGDFLIVEDTLPDDELEVGESFTITPCVLRRQETGDGEVSTKREERAYFGLIFDPAQVRVTDQNGQEVEPAEDGDYYGLVDCQSDGTVYTVTRLSAENIEVSLAAIWPEVEGADLDFATVNWKKFYLGSLDEDEPNEPESGNETSPQGGSGKDKSNSTPASTGKSGKASSSSKSAKTGGTTKTSRTARKTATGDTSDAMLWILLMTATAAACAAAAGSLRKRAR
jgi:hypothetical protein